MTLQEAAEKYGLALSRKAEAIETAKNADLAFCEATRLLGEADRNVTLATRDLLHFVANGEDVSREPLVFFSNGKTVRFAPEQ